MRRCSRDILPGVAIKWPTPDWTTVCIINFSVWFFFFFFNYSLNSPALFTSCFKNRSEDHLRHLRCCHGNEISLTGDFGGKPKSGLGFGCSEMNDPCRIVRVLHLLQRHGSGGEGRSLCSSENHYKPIGKQIRLRLHFYKEVVQEAAAFLIPSELKKQRCSSPIITYPIILFTRPVSWRF